MAAYSTRMRATVAGVTGARAQAALRAARRQRRQACSPVRPLELLDPVVPSKAAACAARDMGMRDVEACAPTVGLEGATVFDGLQLRRQVSGRIRQRGVADAPPPIATEAVGHLAPRVRPCARRGPRGRRRGREHGTGGSHRGRRGCSRRSRGGCFAQLQGRVLRAAGSHHASKVRSMRQPVQEQEAPGQPVGGQGVPYRHAASGAPRLSAKDGPAT